MRDSVPLYHRLKSQLLKNIESGEWPPDTLLPSEPELAKMFAVSRTTVRQAIGDLVAGGYVVRRQGKGTFVSRRNAAHTSRLYGFVEELRLRGSDVSVEVHDVTALPCPAAIAATLECTPDRQIFRVLRVASLAHEPIFHEVSYVVPPYQSELNTLRESAVHFGSVYGFFERSGVRVSLGSQQLSADRATAEDARLLGVKIGDSILAVSRVTRDDTGSVIEFSSVRYDGALYTYEVNLGRATGE